MDAPTRLPPVPPDEWPAELQPLRGGFAGRLNVYRVMAHHPALLSAWAGLRHHVVVANALGPELTEVVILRASHHLGSDYERAHHIVRGRAVGIPDSRIARILSAGGPDDTRDSVITRAVDDLLRLKRLTPETLQLLAELVGPKGVLDLIAVVGFYSTLGYMLNTFDTPIDEDIVAELAKAPLDQAGTHS